MKKILLVLGVVLIGMASCTQNQRAKNFGGTAEVLLPKGQQLVDVTWKDDQIWYLTQDMPEGYKPQNYNFSEESSYGMMEGKVVFKESK